MWRWPAGGVKGYAELSAMSFQLHWSRSRFPLMPAQQKIWHLWMDLSSGRDWAECKSTTCLWASHPLWTQPFCSATYKEGASSVTRGIPASPWSWRGYLQLKAARAHLSSPTLHPSCSIFSMRCIYNQPVFAFVKSPCQHVVNLLFCAKRISAVAPSFKFIVVISQKLEEYQQANNDNNIPAYCKNTLRFWEQVSLDAANRSELNFAYCETSLLGLTPCIFLFLLLWCVKIWWRIRIGGN